MAFQARHSPMHWLMTAWEAPEEPRRLLITVLQCALMDQSEADMSLSSWSVPFTVRVVYGLLLVHTFPLMYSESYT